MAQWQARPAPWWPSFIIHRAGSSSSAAGGSFVGRLRVQSVWRKQTCSPWSTRAFRPAWLASEGWLHREQFSWGWVGLAQAQVLLCLTSTTNQPLRGAKATGTVWHVAK